MLGKTHITGGMLAGSATLLFMQQQLPLLNNMQAGIAIGTSVMTFSTLGALLSDIDEKNSIIGRRLWFISWPIYFLQLLCKLLELLIDLICKITGLHIPSIFKPVSDGIDHRGFTHYPITWLFICSMAAVLGYKLQHMGLGEFKLYMILSLLAGVCIGLPSHIILDCFSGKVRLLAPFNNKRIGLPIVREGSILELVIRLGLLAGSIRLLQLYLSNIVN